MTQDGNSRQASGWHVIVAYSLVCAATQVLWLTYAAITTETARRYGVSVGAVGWLAEIFPLLYVVLAIPAGILLDRWFRPALASGGALVALGGLVRLGGETFVWAMAGQVIVAVAQPVVLSGVSKLAGEYLPAEQRATGIAVGSAGSFVGMLLALVLGPTVGAHGQLERLLVLEAVLAVIPAIGLAIVLRAPGHESEEHAARCGRSRRCARCVAWCSSALASSWRLPPGCRRCWRPPASRKRPPARYWSGWCSPGRLPARYCRRSSLPGTPSAASCAAPC